MIKNVVFFSQVGQHVPDGGESAGVEGLRPRICRDLRKTPAFEGPSVETGPGAKGSYEKRLHSHEEAAAGRPDSWILLP